MLYILYSVVLIYSIPLLAIVFITFYTLFFKTQFDWVIIIANISQTHFSNLRDIFSYILVPLVTAFSVSSLVKDIKVSFKTLILFTYFIIIFILSLFTYGIIQYSKDVIVKMYSLDVYQPYSNLTLNYIKESLTYIALTLGISLKR